MKNETMTQDCVTNTPPVAKACWMVVDDNGDILEALASILEAVGGVTVARFQSGVEALRAFAAAPGDYEFVVTDLEMPGMSGIELCRNLRALAPRLKVLLATGSGIITGREARERGFCGVLPKPFPVAALKQAVALAGL
jgi:CheY-like chemotaxis protein